MLNKGIEENLKPMTLYIEDLLEITKYLDSKEHKYEIKAGSYEPVRSLNPLLEEGIESVDTLTIRITRPNVTVRFSRYGASITGVRDTDETTVLIHRLKGMLSKHENILKGVLASNITTGFILLGLVFFASFAPIKLNKMYSVAALIFLLLALFSANSFTAIRLKSRENTITLKGELSKNWVKWTVSFLKALALTILGYFLNSLGLFEGWTPLEF